jgi:Na+-translocating ferredoxin:NAD+ oxidoreductase RNF subunit RnfB
MAIEKIDTEKCTGCGLCVNSCWMDVIAIDKKKKKVIILQVAISNLGGESLK